MIFRHLSKKFDQFRQFLLDVTSHTLKSFCSWINLSEVKILIFWTVINRFFKIFKTKFKRGKNETCFIFGFKFNLNEPANCFFPFSASAIFFDLFSISSSSVSFLTKSVYVMFLIPLSSSCSTSTSGSDSELLEGNFLWFSFWFFTVLILFRSFSFWIFSISFVYSWLVKYLTVAEYFMTFLYR